MDADIQIMIRTVQTDWLNCQVCDSVALSFLTHGLCHLPYGLCFMVCGLSFHSAAFEHCFWERRVELVLEQALLPVWMGENFSLVGGPNGTSSHRMWSLFRLSRTADKSFGVTLQPLEYSGAPLNEHLSTADTHI